MWKDCSITRIYFKSNHKEYLKNTVKPESSYAGVHILKSFKFDSDANILTYGYRSD